MFDATVSAGVCRLHRPGTRFLSTGFDGGEVVADAAYNVTVPEGWPEQPLQPYVERRLTAAGFGDDSGADFGGDSEDDIGTETPPVLLTGVDQRHAHRARHGSVEAVATAGLSNPAQLPVAGAGADAADGAAGDVPTTTHCNRPGTVNVFVGTTRSLAPGALPNLVAVAAEAKATTLLATTGFPGTTSDAVVVGCDPDGETASFSGAATPVGASARACVRDAITAALDSRYGDELDAALPTSVAEAEHGVVTDETATVEPIAGGDSG
ncbi:adenosylcobinamide amidohydrolase [Haloparvum sp. AD34]